MNEKRSYNGRNKKINTKPHLTAHLYLNKPPIICQGFLADAKKQFCGLSNVTVRPRRQWFMFWKTLAR